MSNGKTLAAGLILGLAVGLLVGQEQPGGRSLDRFLAGPAGDEAQRIEQITSIEDVKASLSRVNSRLAAVERQAADLRLSDARRRYLEVLRDNSAPESKIRAAERATPDPVIREAKEWRAPPRDEVAERLERDRQVNSQFGPRPDLYREDIERQRNNVLRDIHFELYRLNEGR
jgi:hypothetical protein